MAYLEIETHDGSRRVPLERERLSIGRLSYNDVVLPFAQISRQHAELRRIDGKWWIADLQSTNGLQINSRRIQEHALASGDRVVFAPGISILFIADSTGDKSARRPPARASTAGDPASHGVGLLPPLLDEPEPGSPADAGLPDPWAPRPDASADVPESRHEPASDGWAAPPSAFAEGRPFPDKSRNRSDGDGGRGGYDHFRRDSAAFEHARVTAGPVPSLLHVCQTCGQLTPPDAVYCHSCHNSIAHECATCYLSLLPIQERCPRCHTPNLMSVRRAHPGRGG